MTSLPRASYGAQLKLEGVDPIEEMHRICRGGWFRIEAVPDVQVTAWWPDRPEPQVLITSGASIYFGSSLEPDEARAVASALQRSAVVVERARRLCR